MARKIKVFHFGGTCWDNVLSEENFDYFWLPANYDFVRDELKSRIFVDTGLNPRMGRALFLFEEVPKFVKKYPELLVGFPAYQIFCEKSADFSAELVRLLTIKGTYLVDFKNREAIARILKTNYSSGQSGYKIEDRNAEITGSPEIKLEKRGAMFEIRGNFHSEEPIQLMTWRELHIFHADQKGEFYPEIELVSGNLDVFYKLNMVAGGSNEIVTSRTVTLDEVMSRKKIIFHNLTNVDVSMTISLFVQGSGEGYLRVGQNHVRKYLIGDSYMIPGGERIVDEENLGRELHFYFNPGDMKPPLAVYFSGFRTAEGFEGRGMLGGMNCPYILVCDPRLVGGAYYMGSPAFEAELVRKIKEKLNLLGFTNKDLILSGLSMGTYGSLYYSSDLRPHAVIIGKPLASLGVAAKYTHVRRPGSEPMHNILYTHIGGVDDAAVEAFNARFWDKFKSGDHSETIFAIAYMKQDDVDPVGYPRLTETLKEISPSTKVLYKGLIGRHNADTGGIVSWFLKQYHNILEVDFHRPKDSDDAQKKKIEAAVEEVKEAEEGSNVNG